MKQAQFSRFQAVGVELVLVLMFHEQQQVLLISRVLDLLRGVLQLYLEALRVILCEGADEVLYWILLDFLGKEENAARVDVHEVIHEVELRSVSHESPSSPLELPQVVESLVGKSSEQIQFVILHLQKRRNPRTRFFSLSLVSRMDDEFRLLHSRLQVSLYHEEALLLGALLPLRLNQVFVLGFVETVQKKEEVLAFLYFVLVLLRQALSLLQGLGQFLQFPGLNSGGLRSHIIIQCIIPPDIAKVLFLLVEFRERQTHSLSEWLVHVLFFAGQRNSSVFQTLSFGSN